MSVSPVRFVRRHVPVALVAAALAASPAIAGAWTSPRGSWYHKLALNYFASDTGFNASHDEVPFQLDGRFTDSNLTYYVEYGILDRLTIFGSLPVKKIRYENAFEEGTTTGIADVELGVRGRLVAKGPFVLALQGLVRVPGGYDGADRLPLGNDQRDVEARILAGGSALNGRIYFGGEAAYRHRADAPSDEWRFLVELGGDFTRRFYGRIKLDEIRSVENQDDVRDVFGNPLAQLASELRRAELTLGVRLAPKWFGEAMWAPIVYGTSIAKGATATLAFVWVH